MEMPCLIIARTRTLNSQATSLCGHSTSVMRDVRHERGAGFRIAPSLHVGGSTRIAFPDFDDLCALVWAFELRLDGPGGLEVVGFERFGILCRQQGGECAVGHGSFQQVTARDDLQSSLPLDLGSSLVWILQAHGLHGLL